MELSERAKRFRVNGIRMLFEKSEQYENTINFGIGEPGFQPGQNVIDRTCWALNNGHTKYVPNAGYLPLRNAVAKRSRELNGLDCDVSNVHIFIGATHAIMMAMQCILDPGDDILIPCPYYAAYQGMADMAGANIIEVPVYEKDHFHVKAENLERCLTPKTKAILLNSPSNPLGSVTPPEDLKEIAELAIRRDLWVISDEPYESLLYDGAKQMSIGSLPGMFERTITCNSCSKTYAMTGFRVGWFVAPAELCARVTMTQSSVTSSVPDALQVGALEALEGPQDYVQEMVREYDVRRKMMVEGLNRIKGFSCLAPEGAFYTFPNIQETGMKSWDLAMYLLDQVQVITVPGISFGQFGEGYLRVSFCTGTEDIREGLSRMEKLFGTK